MMTLAPFAAGASSQPPFDAAYRPGVCNIGPAEIARRRMAGHVGVAVTLGLFAVLVAVDAQPAFRLVLAFPATMAASGYLQARLRFCAAFGSRGVFNLGGAGDVEAVVDAESRRRDRRRATEIGLASLAIGLAVGAAAALLPV
jgi:hypothetical protein